MKGILFKPDMHHAIREGRKTVTRRIINPQPGDKLWQETFPSGAIGWKSNRTHQYGNQTAHFPRLNVGEILYIKEAWALLSEKDMDYEVVYYKLDGVNIGDLKWHSPMLLKAEYARDFIQITDVRPERLREITEEEAVKEGFTVSLGITSGGSIGLMSALACFKEKWDSINPQYPWASNPWVWRYEFKKVERPQ